MAAQDIVNQVFREFTRYTGDGKPGEPTNAPLPVGDPQSGVYNPKKSELRNALLAVLGAYFDKRGVTTLAQLNAIVPPAGTRPVGAVFDDPDPANNGEYYWSGTVWIKGRDFPDTFARVTLTGSGAAQTATTKPRVNPASIEVFFAKVVTVNTGPLTLSISGGAARSVVNLPGNPLSAGEWTGMVMFYLNEEGQYQLLIDAGAAASAAASAGLAGQEADRAAGEAERAQAAAEAAQAAGANEFAATRVALKALNTAAFSNVYLTEAGREGQFRFKTGNFSAEVALDVGEGIYVKANDTAASAGAWVRQHDNKYFAKWFGAKEDGITNDAVSLQRASDLCNSGSRPIPLVLTGLCMTNSAVIINRAVGTAAGADTFSIIAQGKFAGFTSALAGAIIDSSLPFIGPFNDTPACNIRFENVTFLGAGNPATTCVSDKFLKVHFEACRFNAIKCVVAAHYLQSWRWSGCSMIAWPSWFAANVGPYYDCHWIDNDFESGGNGIKSFEDGFVGSSLINNLFENSGQFFSQARGRGTTIIGNYTEANSAPDYQLCDAVNYGPHHGTVFTGNFMGIHTHGLHNVIVGDAQGFMAGGNYTDTRLYDTTNTTPGSFKSNGDFAGISKFSVLGSFDADHAGDYAEAILPSGTPSGLVTGVAKNITSLSLPPGDWDVSGVVGYTPAGTTSASRYSSSISTVSNTVGAEGSANVSVFPPFVNGGFAVNYPTPVVRLSLAVATTVYLVGFADFTVSTMTAFGRIRARKAGGR